MPSKIAIASVLAACSLLGLLASGCGYHVAGASSSLPPGIKVIAVPVFQNDTKRYRIDQIMTGAVVHEFLARTKYRIVPAPNEGDAVLHGEITGFDVVPVVFNTTPVPALQTTGTTINTATAAATTMLVSVHMKVVLQQRDTEKVLYKNDNYLFRQPYEISIDPSKFFDEQSPALERMSRDFAERLVADILENF